MKIIDLIFPRRCPICDEIIPFGTGLICDKCNRELPYVISPTCYKCGKPIDNPEKQYCFDCEKNKKLFEKGFSVFLYDDKLKKSIEGFKYQNKREYADFYVYEAVKKHKEELKTLNLDAIIPIPMYKKKVKIRGYNQAEIIGKKLSEQLEIPLYKDILIREKNTLPQNGLDDKTRRKNLKKAFNIRPNEVQLRYILLVDDIYTTGATIDACTDVLLQYGVEKVYFLSICIGKGM